MDLRLFLPEVWTRDPPRCGQAGVPEPATVLRSKSEIALCELDRLRVEGLRFGTVLADAGYGVSAAFRHNLDARGLRWAVGIVRNQKVYAADVRLVPPTGRARKPAPDREPRDAEAGLRSALAARDLAPGYEGQALGPVRRPPGAGRRRSGLGQQPAPAGRRAWLVGEWCSSGERKYYLSNLPPGTSRRALAGTIKARWVCEQAHQQLKEELGLDHFEGRSWTGLQHLRLASIVGRGGEI